MWVCLYLHKIDEKWSAMLVAGDESPPKPGTLNGIEFYGGRREEAEEAANVYVGTSEPGNRSDGHKSGFQKRRIRGSNYLALADVICGNA